MSYQKIRTMSNAKEITLENIITTEIVLDGNQLDTEIDLGSITLINNEKSFVVDVVQSYRNYDEDENTTLIEIEVEIDKDLFKDTCNFDLTDLDLLSPNLKGTLYINSEEDLDIKSMVMLVKVRQTTKNIDLVED